MIDKKTDVEIEKLRERFDLPQIEYPEDRYVITSFISLEYVFKIYLIVQSDFQE